MGESVTKTQFRFEELRIVARQELDRTAAQIGAAPSPAPSGLYDEPGGETWGTRPALAQATERGVPPISNTGLSKRFKRRRPDAATITLQYPNGIFDGYRLADALEVTSDLAEVKIFLPESGIYIDEEEKEWATVQL